MSFPGGLNTYAGLLHIIRANRLAFPAKPEELDTIERVERYVNLLAGRYKHASRDEQGLQNIHRPRIDVLGEAGVEGWVRAIERGRRMLKMQDQQNEASDANSKETEMLVEWGFDLAEEVERLESLVRRLEDKEGSAEGSRAAGLQGAEGENESFEELRGSIERLEAQVDRLDRLSVALPTRSRSTDLPRVADGPHDSDNHGGDAESLETRLVEPPGRRTRPVSDSSTTVEVGSSIGQPMLADYPGGVGSGAEGAVDYPPLRPRSTRDEGEASSREDVPISDLRNAEQLNFMHVRTIEMDRELKNTLRKMLTKDEWESKGMDHCRIPGNGKTFITSKGNFHFSSVDWAYDSNCWCASDEEEFEDGPYCGSQLRAGASPNIQKAGVHRRSAGESGDISFEDRAEILEGMLEEDGRQCSHVWTEYARILQLQNASLSRMIESLQEIIRDTEDTVREQSARVERVYEKSKRAVRKARGETRKARKEAAAAKKELEALRGAFRAHPTDGNLESKHSFNSIEWCGNKAPRLRGGQAGRHPTPPNPASDPHPEDNRGGISPGAFLFFPGVSMAVLFTNTLRYFQWPRGTSLAQIQSSLVSRHAHGQETNPGLGAIRAILCTRDRLGIALPDTSDGRQVLIAVPEQDTRESAEQREDRAAVWERSFGSDQFERVCLEGISRVQVPESARRSPPDPAGSDGGGSFCDVGYLIDSIDEEVGSCLSTLDRELGPTAAAGEQASSGRRAPRLQLTREIGVQVDPPRHSTPSASPKRGGSKTAPAPKQCTKRIVPNSSCLRCSPDMPEVQLWHVLNIPRRDDPAAYEAMSELDRSANWDYEVGLGTSQHSPTTAATDTKDNEGDYEWQMWRHHKGEGCESWVDELKLEKGRTSCTFCHLPFVHEGWHKRVFNGSDGSERRKTATPPPGRMYQPSVEDAQDESSEEVRGRMYNATASRDPPSLSPKSLNPRLRGGSASEDPDWHVCWANLSSKFTPLDAFLSPPLVALQARTRSPESSSKLDSQSRSRDLSVCRREQSKSKGKSWAAPGKQPATRPWVPSTAAGPSSLRRACRMSREESEYDGMIWGWYR